MMASHYLIKIIRDVIMAADAYKRSRGPSSGSPLQQCFLPFLSLFLSPLFYALPGSIISSILFECARDCRSNLRILSQVDGECGAVSTQTRHRERDFEGRALGDLMPFKR